MITNSEKLSQVMEEFRIDWIKMQEQFSSVVN
jgi:hypothetical protein